MEEKKSNDKWYDNLLSGWYPIIFGICTMIVSVILSQLQNVYGWLITIISLVFVICLFCIFNFFIIIPYKKKSDELKTSIGNSTNEFKKILSDYLIEKNKFEIISNEEMALYEATCNPNEVWVISYDLAGDAGKETFKNAVKENLNRGVKYIYFVPKTNIVIARKQQIINYNNNNKNLNFVYLEEDFFFLVSAFNYVLYNPLLNTTEPKIGYVGLPTITNNTYYHAKMSNELFDTLIGKLYESYANTISP